MDTLAVAVFLATVIKAVLDHVAEPIRVKYPNLDLWWFNYVTLVLGGIVAWLGELNLFADYLPNEILGRVLTALLIGGGAKLLNDVFSNAPRRAAASHEQEVLGRSLTIDERARVQRPRGW